MVSCTASMRAPLVLHCELVVISYDDLEPLPPSLIFVFIFLMMLPSSIYMQTQLHPPDPAGEYGSSLFSNGPQTDGTRTSRVDLQ